MERKRTNSASKKKKSPAQYSGKKLRAPQPQKANATSFKPGNQYVFPKGVSGNPGGRPKLLSDAYREWLGLVCEKTELTHAQILAQKIGQRAIITMDVQSAKEIRAATEGTVIKAWQDEIIALLKEGTLKPEQVIEELGDDARAILVAAGAAAIQDRPAQAESGTEQGESQSPTAMDAAPKPDAA